MEDKGTKASAVDAFRHEYEALVDQICVFVRSTPMSANLSLVPSQILPHIFGVFEGHQIARCGASRWAIMPKLTFLVTKLNKRQKSGHINCEHHR
ncbi:hypothetical protein BS47DRAFT_1487517 [Hydnum rufescens UP504]|uniref:Uncharacterized protein n=1 Tax=Hydnum rufescens UP504 TaxID=1448309 RepID=A0A9P6DQS8_9AGAM|nr:hypothetical protein BS47DRAFT_1487517 [Hydnum rufescens UP504]